MIQITPEAIEKTTAQFVMKVNHFDSDNTRRDSHMLEVLEGFVYPTITWNVTSVSGAAGPWSPGVTKFMAHGPLTVHGVTKDVAIPVEITVGGQGEIAFDGQFTILLEEYGIERPTLVFVPIENELPIIVQVNTNPNPDVLPAPKATEATPAPETDGAEAGAVETDGGEKDAAGDSEPPAQETGRDE